MDQSSDLSLNASRDGRQSICLERLQGLGRSPSAAFIKAHSTIFFQPVLGYIREKLERCLRVFELDAATALAESEKG